MLHRKARLRVGERRHPPRRVVGARKGERLGAEGGGLARRAGVGVVGVGAGILARGGDGVQPAGALRCGVVGPRGGPLGLGASRHPPELVVGHVADVVGSRVPGDAPERIVLGFRDDGGGGGGHGARGAGGSAGEGGLGTQTLARLNRPHQLRTPVAVEVAHPGGEAREVPARARRVVARIGERPVAVRKRNARVQARIARPCPGEVRLSVAVEVPGQGARPSPRSLPLRSRRRALSLNSPPNAGVAALFANFSSNRTSCTEPLHQHHEEQSDYAEHG